MLIVPVTVIIDTSSSLGHSEPPTQQQIPTLVPASLFLLFHLLSLTRCLSRGSLDVVGVISGEEQTHG
ncbi:hypothetical protein AGIG_G12802 [Arapaima gigas]